MVIKTKLDVNRVINKLNSLNLDKPWQVDIKLYVKNRSLAQNKLLWKWLTCIGDEIGYTKDEMYLLMCNKFLEVIEVIVMGKVIQKQQTSSDLNTKEFTVFLENIDRFASSELGIVLPSPADLYYEAMGVKP